MERPPVVEVADASLNARVRVRVRSEIGAAAMQLRGARGVVVRIAADVIGGDAGKIATRKLNFSAFLSMLLDTEAVIGIAMPGMTPAMLDAFVELPQSTRFFVTELPRVDHDLVHDWLLSVESETQKAVFARFWHDEKEITEMLFVLSPMERHRANDHFERAIATRTDTRPIQHLHVTCGAIHRAVDANWLIEQLVTNDDLDGLEELELVRLRADYMPHTEDEEDENAIFDEVYGNLPSKLEALYAEDCELHFLGALAMLARVRSVTLVRSRGPELVAESIVRRAYRPGWKELSIRNTYKIGYEGPAFQQLTAIFRTRNVAFPALEAAGFGITDAVTPKTVNDVFVPLLAAFVTSALPALAKLRLSLGPGSTPDAAATLLRALDIVLHTLHTARQRKLAVLQLEPLALFHKKGPLLKRLHEHVEQIQLFPADTSLP